MGSLLPVPAKAAEDLGRPRSPRRRCRPGSPARRTPRRRPRARGGRDRRGPDGRTRSRWPTAYCGSAPPQRCTCGVDRSHGRARSRRARSASASCDELVVVDAGGAAPRGAARSSTRSSTTPSASPARAHPVPLGEREGRRLDRRACRPAAPGTPIPAVSGKSRVRKARVTTAIEAYSIRASSSAASGTTSASSRLVAAAGVASTTASACSTSASRVGADDEVPAALGGAGQVAHGGTGAHVEARRRDDRLRQLADAADEPGEDRHVGGRPAGPGAAAFIIDRSRSSRATTCGTAARAEISRACPA